MLVLKTIAEVRSWRKEQTEGEISFVPTMGALHEGHLQLVKAAKKVSNKVVVSIFVNPSQFAPTEDLDKYPRDVDSDISKLTGLADVIFLPSVSELYPSGITLEVSEQVGTFVHVLGLSHQLEGVTRPHFFRGVATVVCKLLNVVQPHYLLLGQKDAQQCRVVKSMVSDLCINTQVLVQPIVREVNGLAMSSRNRYLSKQIVEGDALALYEALKRIETLYLEGVRTRKELLDAANLIFNKYPDVYMEYLSLANPKTLAELDTIGDEGALISGAIKVKNAEGTGQVRLIDNLLLNCVL